MQIGKFVVAFQKSNYNHCTGFYFPYNGFSKESACYFWRYYNNNNTTTPTYSNFTLATWKVASLFQDNFPKRHQMKAVENT